MRVGKVDKRVLGPVLMGFFIMGFCDMVAPITGRIALEFPASRQAAVSFLPTMVFLWFLVLSTPLAALMNRIGRKATALIGYAFTVVGLMVPYVAGEGCALGWYFAGFGLLGVGNTAIQVAINPLLATIVPGERMTSYLTVGQIFRNTSLLLLAPIVTALVALTGSWRLLLPIYAGLTVLGGIWLQATRRAGIYNKYPDEYSLSCSFYRVCSARVPRIWFCARPALSVQHTGGVRTMLK